MFRAEICVFLLPVALMLCVFPASADIGGWPFSSGTAVCSKWTADWPMTTTTYATGVNTSTCTAGNVTAATKTDVRRVVNMFRYFAGIDAVSFYDSTKDQSTQDCVLMCARNGSIRHTDWSAADSCYSAAGSTGCYSSNLASGVSVPNQVVALWMQDNGVPSLGHRRWILSPTLNGISFGMVNSYSSLYVVGTQANNLTRGYWTWPPSGYVPLQAVLAYGTPTQWSYATAADIFAITTCTVTYNAASILTGSCSFDNGNYGPYNVVRSSKSRVAFLRSL